MSWMRSLVCQLRYRTQPIMGAILSRCLHESSSPEPCGLKNLSSRIQGGEMKNITVLAGAGISTASGIPDFRSPGTGLYDNLQKYELPYPEAIFELGYFHRRPEAFFQLAQELYPSGKYRPNVGHYFPALLQQKGLLRRMYTQNIDGLERIAGIEDDRLVEAHGTFHSATCLQCGNTYRGEDIKVDIFAGVVPRCRKDQCSGVIKPDIVFFGEPLPQRFFDSAEDLINTDLLLVMGTSLEVYPFAGLAEATRRSVPRVLFNRDVAGTFAHDPRENDVIVTGDIVAGIEKFCSLLGWTEDLKQLMDNNEYSQES